MELLESWTILHGGAPRTIELLTGDLSALPEEHAVDLMIVSAFPDDYLATSTSLIGALQRAGLSVAGLAQDKLSDWRSEFPAGCRSQCPNAFISGPFCVSSQAGAGPRRRSPMISFALSRHVSSADPGSFRWPCQSLGLATKVTRRTPCSILFLKAAVSWIGRGLPLRCLKIVVRSSAVAELAREVFLDQRRQQSVKAGLKREVSPSSRQCDVFLSYCHLDHGPANVFYRSLKAQMPLVNIFFDQVSIKNGASWLMQVAEFLDAARRVVAFYTPAYWSSPNCKDEFAAALARQNDTTTTVLYPIYLSSASILYLFRNLQFADCRENDEQKMTAACGALARELNTG